MESFRIVALCIATAVVFGVLHDQITARVCVEYFTIGHPPVFETENPTLLAFGWGFLATWWVGALLGGLLATAARAGRLPKLTAAHLLRPLLFLMACTALGALLFGLAGYAGALFGAVWLVDPLASLVPPGMHACFLADLWAHSASYGFGFAGGTALSVMLWRRRRRLAAPTQASGGREMPHRLRTGL